MVLILYKITEGVLFPSVIGELRTRRSMSRDWYVAAVLVMTSLTGVLIDLILAFRSTLLLFTERDISHVVYSKNYHHIYLS